MALVARCFDPEVLVASALVLLEATFLSLSEVVLLIHMTLDGAIGDLLVAAQSIPHLWKALPVLKA